MLKKNNTMKKLIVMACIAAGFTLSAQAQDSSAAKIQHKNKHSKEWKHDGKAKLDLTADQQEKMKAMRAEFKIQAKAINDNSALTEDQKKEQLKALHVKNRQQMKAVLTPDQQQKVAEQRKNLRKQHKTEVKRK